MKIINQESTEQLIGQIIKAFLLNQDMATMPGVPTQRILKFCKFQPHWGMCEAELNLTIRYSVGLV